MCRSYPLLTQVVSQKGSFVTAALCHGDTQFCRPCRHYRITLRGKNEHALPHFAQHIDTQTVSPMTENGLHSVLICQDTIIRKHTVKIEDEQLHRAGEFPGIRVFLR